MPPAAKFRIGFRRDASAVAAFVHDGLDAGRADLFQQAEVREAVLGSVFQKGPLSVTSPVLILESTLVAKVCRYCRRAHAGIAMRY
jgi:hypothetical protein